MLKRAMATDWSDPGSNYRLVVTAQLTNQNINYTIMIDIHSYRLQCSFKFSISFY
jgi:hypothetical protein